MDEFLNLKDDDETKNEERDVKVRDEAVVKEGKGPKTRETKVTEQGTEARAEEVPVGGTTQGVTNKRPWVSEAGPSKDKKKKSQLAPSPLIVGAAGDNSRPEVVAPA